MAKLVRQHVEEEECAGLGLGPANLTLAAARRDLKLVDSHALEAVVEVPHEVRVVQRDALHPEHVKHLSVALEILRSHDLPQVMVPVAEGHHPRLIPAVAVRIRVEHDRAKTDRRFVPLRQQREERAEL